MTIGQVSYVLFDNLFYFLNSLLEEEYSLENKKLFKILYVPLAPAWSVWGFPFDRFSSAAELSSKNEYDYFIFFVIAIQLTKLQNFTWGVNITDNHQIIFIINNVNN